MTQAIFFSGPIGAGKSTLGRAVAGRLGAAFLDGDDFADHRRPWYASSLGTSRSIATALLDALRQSPSAIVAYPLRCTNYVYFRRRMADAGHGLSSSASAPRTNSSFTPGVAASFPLANAPVSPKCWRKVTASGRSATSWSTLRRPRSMPPSISSSPGCAPVSAETQKARTLVGSAPQFQSPAGQEMARSSRPFVTGIS
jgi:hypothetical protein